MAAIWSLQAFRNVFWFCSLKMRKLEVVKVESLPHFLFFFLSLAKHFHPPLILICFAPFVLVASARFVLFYFDFLVGFSFSLSTRSSFSETSWVPFLGK